MSRQPAKAAKPAKPPAVQLGPQTGAPPSLEQVAIDRLQVDPAYQRATDGAMSRRIIAGMIREWKWPLCQPLVVSRRADGSLFVLDGQHRLAGARARGDLPYLPCVILASLEATAEAKAFVELNTRRQRLSQADIFNGMLAAGDADAVALADLLQETGWRIVRSKNTRQYKPGDLTCAPMLVRELRSHGAATVRAALVTLRRAWPDRPVAAGSNFLLALIGLFKPRSPFPTFDIDALAQVIGRLTPEYWLNHAARIQSQEPALTRVTAITAAIARSAAATVAASQARPAPAPIKTQSKLPPAPAHVAPLSDDRFGASGKGWCGQCEQLVTRDRAAACKSPFCAMRKAEAA